jgi:hypothetical protein
VADKQRKVIQRYSRAWCSACHLAMEAMSTTVESPSHIRCPRCRTEVAVVGTLRYALKGMMQGDPVYKIEVKAAKE